MKKQLQQSNRNLKQLQQRRRRRRRRRRHNGAAASDNGVILTYIFWLKYDDGFFWLQLSYSPYTCFCFCALANAAASG